MARQPQYPDADATIGSPKGASGTSAPAPASETEAAASTSGEAKRSKHLVTGAAIGIGSAAIVAALLYANRRTRSPRHDGR